MIFGAGPIGLLLGLLGKYLGAKKVVIVDPLESRLLVAKNIGACDYVIPFDRKYLVKKAFAITDGKGFDRVFTACPVSETHALAMELVSVMDTFTKYSFKGGGSST